METAIRTVTSRLTQEEINHKAHRLADTISEKGKIIAEKKSATAHFKAAIDKKDELIAQLSYEITTGEVTEDVKCIVIKDYEAGVKRYVHEGEIVAEEKLSADERQLSIAQ